MKFFVSFTMVALFMLAIINVNVAVADEAEFLTVVAKNDKFVGGDFHLDLEIRIKDGSASPRTVSSFQVDIYYGSELSEPTVTNWASDLSNDKYLLTNKDFTAYYRLAAIGLNVPEGEGWDVSTVWQRVVTLKWVIAKATLVNISINDATNGASYFKNLHNSPSGGGSVAWIISNEDLGDVSLPVELSFFTALADDTKVILRWETGSEVGNIGFYVYRSETADGQFEKISKLIDGAGNSPIGSTYEYLDKNIEPNKTYFYYLEDIDVQGIRDKSETIKITVPLPKKPPKETLLFQNYPNPFNSETWIPFQLAKASYADILIYDATGRIVKTIPLGLKQAEVYRDKSKVAYWDGRNKIGEKVASGVYFYELRTEAFRTIKKMFLVK